MSTACFHCGAPLPAGTSFTAMVGGRSEPVCCPGCAAVAALIEQAGLARFYDFRTAPSAKPAAARADVARWSVCDRPEVAAEITRPAAGGQRELTCRVDGVTCAACSWLIGSGLRALGGVAETSVNPLTAETVVRFDPNAVRPSEILAAIERFGFAPRVQPLAGGDGTERQADRAALKRLAVAGLGAMQVMTLSAALYVGAVKHMAAAYHGYFVLVSMLIATPVVLYSGAPIFAGALRDLVRRRLGMDVPVALALAAALGASLVNALRGAGEVYFDSAVMFLFFLSLGRFLESRARYKAGGIFNALADLRPLAATRLQGATLERVGTIELAIGDRVLVAPGEAVPADGELVSERGSFDESLLSGESLGRTRVRGDAVLGGSLNAGTAPLEITVTRLGADSYLERIRSLLSRALADRPEFLAVADRFARGFVAALLLVTLAAGAVWAYVAPARALDVVLALLVVTCPCALSLAAPTAFAVALGRLAQQGLLLRSARVLERLRDVRLWLFDKTGTLTDGRIGVATVTTYDKVDVHAALGIAAALEGGIEHPLARALRAEALDARVPVALAEAVEYRAGFGVTGRVAGVRYRLGSARFVGVVEEGAPPRCVYLAADAGVLARIDLADTVRPYAREALAALAANGAAVMLVSGDAPAAVAAVAAEVGATRWLGAQTPVEKLAALTAAQRDGAVVAAVGDGVNDAPLLAQADVSIAIQSGSRLAQSAADVVFTGDDLRVLVRLPALAAATRRVVRQNLAWAVAYNAIAVPLAALGAITPWMAAIGMSLSSLVVVGNALALGRRLAPPRAPGCRESPGARTTIETPASGAAPEAVTAPASAAMAKSPGVAAARAESDRGSLAATRAA